VKVCYLDIETLYIGKCVDQKIFDDYENHELTVVGLLVIDEETGYKEFKQLVPGVPWMTPPTRDNFLAVVEGVRKIITYNGRWWKAGPYDSEGFDGPVLSAQIGIDWEALQDNEIYMIDLVLNCWAASLYGGMKKVEAKLGIERLLPSKDGKWAIRIWNKWKETEDEAYLDLLCVYNKEDVYKLREIESALKDKDNHTVDEDGLRVD